MRTKIKARFKTIISILVCVMMVLVTCPVNMLSGAAFAQDEVQTPAIPSEVELLDDGQEISLEGGGGAALEAKNVTELQAKIDAAQDGDTIKLTKELIIDRHASDTDKFMFQICDKKITITTDNPANKISRAYTSDIGLFEIKGKNASLTLENIEIEGNSATSTGTLIEIDEGSLTIGQNAKISKYYSYECSMICCRYDATVNINGGEISECISPRIIDSEGGSIVNINGGKISRCCGIKSCAAGSGVIFCVGGTVNVNGGEIFGCRSDDSGGAIHCYRNTTVNINGGKISECYAKCGGAIYCGDGGTINIKAGEITECDAAPSSETYYGNDCYGGAVFCSSGGTVNIDGGKISECCANSGGAIYCRGTVNISGGEISGCHAKYGGAIYLEPYAKARLEKGTITGCYVEGRGSAIYVKYDATCDIAKKESGLFKILNVQPGGDIDTDPSSCAGYSGIYLFESPLYSNGDNKNSNASFDSGNNDNTSGGSGGGFEKVIPENINLGDLDDMAGALFDANMVEEDEKDDDVDMIDDDVNIFDEDDEIENEKYEDEDDEIGNEEYEDEDDEIENDKGAGEKEKKGAGEKEKNDVLGTLAPWLIGAAVVAIGAVVAVVVLKKRGVN